MFLDHIAIISVSVCFGASRDHFSAIILGDHFVFFIYFSVSTSAIILVGDHFSGYRLYISSSSKLILVNIFYNSKCEEVETLISEKSVVIKEILKIKNGCLSRVSLLKLSNQVSASSITL